MFSVVKYITFKDLVGQDQYWQNICTCCNGDNDDGYLKIQNAFAVDVEKSVMCLWFVELCRTVL